MYCVKCGVELADSERKCPLCQTPVYLPGLTDDPERPYPKFERPEPVNPRGILFIVSFVCIIASVISLVCDINLNGGLTWAGYVLGGIWLSYAIIILPSWFQRYNPAIFVPVSFLGIELYLCYINYAIAGGWFLTFAMPITAVAAVLVSTITILSYYLRCGYLYIWGGTVIAAALFCPIMEYLANMTFLGYYSPRWGIYPFIALSLIGIMLILIAIIKPLRESLCRIFAI